jgi:ABC-type transport system involved in multi-copper enzyme maturation permease subunit
MIHSLALHRLGKLRSSKIIWVFVGACLFLGLTVFLPVVLFSKMATIAVAGQSAATVFFKFVNFMGHLAALILGITTWRQDYRDGTLLTFAARPIARIELLAGKVLGSIYGLLIYLTIAVMFYALVHLIFFHFSLPAIASLYLLQLLAGWISTFSLGLLFSNFGNPLVATFLAAAYWFLSLLGGIFQKVPVATLQGVGKVLRMISIDNDRTYKLEEILKSDLPSLAPIWQTIAYYGLWALLLLAITVVLFNRREFIGKRS